MEFLYIEDSELIYTNLNEPASPTLNLTSGSISTVFYGVRTRKLFFGLIKIPEQHITIRASGKDYTVTQRDVGCEKLAEYTEAVKKFCHDHRVTIRETTGDSKDDYRY